MSRIASFVVCTGTGVLLSFVISKYLYDEHEAKSSRTPCTGIVTGHSYSGEGDCYHVKYVYTYGGVEVKAESKMGSGSFRKRYPLGSCVSIKINPKDQADSDLDSMDLLQTARVIFFIGILCIITGVGELIA